MRKTARFSLGVRLSLVQAVIVLVVMGIFTFALSTSITRKIEQRTEKDLSQQALLLVNSMSAYHVALSDSAYRMAAVFRSFFPGSFSLDQTKSVTIGDKQTPILKNGSTTLNLNNE